jgi:ribonuclease BN (tRNA processing enzyme)
MVVAQNGRREISAGRPTVRVTVVPSSIASDGGELPGQYLISYLINDTLAIDAGSLGLFGSPDEQARIRHVLITHGHIDHTATLPIFLENAFEAKADCVTIHGSDAVLDGLRRDTFNDRTWPDFLALSETLPTPLVRLSRLEPYQPVVLEGLTITPVPVDHVVPTLGFVVSDGATTVVIPSDTGPTEAIWKVANESPGLAAVFLEASFPDERSALANASRHLTPSMFGAEVRKLSRPVPVVAVHLKARYRREIVEQLTALGLSNVSIGRPGEVYEL